jgi:hypothetical protein
VLAPTTAIACAGFPTLSRQANCTDSATIPGAEVECWSGCNGRGRCRAGWCQCEPGYWGVDCSLSLAPSQQPGPESSATPHGVGQDDVHLDGSPSGAAGRTSVAHLTPPIAALVSPATATSDRDKQKGDKMGGSGSHEAVVRSGWGSATGEVVRTAAAIASVTVMAAPAPAGSAPRLAAPRAAQVLAGRGYRVRARRPWVYVYDLPHRLTSWCVQKGGGGSGRLV